jgi:recombination protein RecT
MANNEVAAQVQQKKPLSMVEYIAATQHDVLSSLQEKQKTGMVLPKNYVPMNALSAALLTIQQVQDKDHNLALSVCSPESVKQSLNEMLQSGLNPAKKQCYFIVYGKKLVMQTSYFGEVAKAKYADPTIDDIYSEVVYVGDTFRYSIKRGHKVITEHVQAPENIKLANIVGAYATIVYKDGREVSDYMTKEQINNSWSRGQTKGASDAHKLAPEEMSKKTVLRRLCKAIYNTSDDTELMYDDEAKAIDESIDAQQNQRTIDITPETRSLPAGTVMGRVDEDGVITDDQDPGEATGDEPEGFPVG